jgi:hypothetical protein
MTVKFKILFIGIFSLVLFACEKDNVELIPSGIMTNVHGRITSRNGEPVSNVIIRVGEYKEYGGASYPSGFGSPSIDLIQYANTVHTDADGNYDFVFVTSGKGNLYRLEVGQYSASAAENQAYWGYYSQAITQFPNDKTHLGKPFEYNNDQLVKLYPCEVTLQFNGATIFPIGLFHEYTYPMYLPDVSSSETTVRKIFIDQFTDQKLILSRRKPNLGAEQTATYIFPASHTPTPTAQTVIVNESDFVDI